VTVNTHESIYWLGKVVDGEMKLNKIGKIVNDCLTNIPNYAEFCEIDAFIVMPNHLHVIIVINDRLVGDDLLVVPMGQTRRFVPTVKRKSVSEIVKNFKTYSSKIIHEKFPNVSFQWQRSFYDHVIRNEFALGRIRQYILNNPPKWEFDRNNFESKIPLKKRGAW
jgi:REP element-mobilizing transposase RayT